jgi:type II secretion system protein J
MRTRAFTLIELVMALAASAIILAAVYGLFSKAIHLRNNATERTRISRVRAHAASVIRNDLANAIVSGGTMANVLEGSRDSGTSFPGYLKFISTTQRDAGDEILPSNDIQQVEYYITTDPDSGDSRAGMLVRAVDRNLLATTRQDPPQEELLAGIESMEVEFFDGDSWQTSWKYSEDDTTLPEAIRVRIQPAAAAADETKPAPIEVLVPWTAQPATEKTEDTAQ